MKCTSADEPDGDRPDNCLGLIACSELSSSSVQASSWSSEATRLCRESSTKTPRKRLKPSLLVRLLLEFRQYGTDVFEYTHCRRTTGFCMRQQRNAVRPRDSSE